MFIALSLNMSALQRSAMCFGVFSYMALLRSGILLFTKGYKHLAPPEQRPKQLNMTFRAKHE